MAGKEGIIVYRIITGETGPLEKRERIRGKVIGRYEGVCLGEGRVKFNEEVKLITLGRRDLPLGKRVCVEKLLIGGDY